MNDDDYRLNSQGQFKRSYIKSELVHDIVYERMSKYGMTLRRIKEFYPDYYAEHELDQYPNQDMCWQAINHLEEELSEYENSFNKIVMDDRVENSGRIHVDKDCYCSTCMLINRFKRIEMEPSYDQFIVRDDKHYIRVNGSEFPVSDYIDTLC